MRLNQSCIPGLKKLIFSNRSTRIGMIILTLLCALLVFLITGAIQLHFLDCSEVHHHMSLEKKLLRAVPSAQHFYNKKRVSFLHLSQFCLNYSLSGKEMRVGGLRKRACFAGMEHFYLWLVGKLSLSFWKTVIKHSGLENTVRDSSSPPNKPQGLQ